MDRYYSKTTGNTYIEGFHSYIPSDAKIISDDRYEAVIANPAPGKIRSHDADGLPILIDPQPHIPTYQEELAALNKEYQEDVEAFNKAFSLATLFDGVTEEAKKVTIREQYAARKNKYVADLGILRIKHEV